MAVYRVISTDLRTGTRIAELAVSSLQFGSRLNNAGELSGVVPLPNVSSASERALAAQINDAVDEGRRQLIVERDGSVVWAGIVWLSPYTDSPPQRQVRAAETWSYFRHRIISYDKTFTAGVDDQTSIAQTLLTNAQAAAGGDIGVTYDCAASGVTRTRTYNSFEIKPVAEAIEQLAQCNNGFDFAIDAAWNSTVTALTKTFRTSYPRRGRPFGSSGHVFEVGRNVIEWTWPSDGTRIANNVTVVGRGEGDAMLASIQSDVSQIVALSSGGPGYPLLESAVSYSDISEQSTLDALAKAHLNVAATPIVLPEVTVRADRDPVFGSYITGDSCRFILPPNTTPRFPAGLDLFMRIYGWDVSVSDDGAETVKLILGSEFVG